MAHFHFLLLNTLLTYDGINTIWKIMFIVMIFVVTCIFLDSRSTLREIRKGGVNRRDDQTTDPLFTSIEAKLMEAIHQILPLQEVTSLTHAHCVLNKINERVGLKTLEEYTGEPCTAFEERWPGRNICARYNAFIHELREGHFTEERLKSIVAELFTITHQK